MTGRIVMSLTLCALIMLPGLACSNGRAVAPQGPEDFKGKDAVDFTLMTVDGHPITLSALKGNVVVVDFWATWCPPCRLSLPHLQKLANDPQLSGKGLRVIAVDAREDASTVQKFMTKNNYTFDAPLDAEGKVMDAYAVSGIPATLIIGRDGKVRDVFVGFNPDTSPQRVDDAVAAALAEK